MPTTEDVMSGLISSNRELREENASLTKAATYLAFSVLLLAGLSLALVLR